MVSPWCSNGTIVHYLKANPEADRLELLAQISSGLSYLHNFKPIVVHGDLKGVRPHKPSSEFYATHHIGEYLDQ